MLFGFVCGFFDRLPETIFGIGAEQGIAD